MGPPAILVSCIVNSIVGLIQMKMATSKTVRTVYSTRFLYSIVTGKLEEVVSLHAKLASSVQSAEKRASCFGLRVEATSPPR